MVVMGTTAAKSGDFMVERRGYPDSLGGYSWGRKGNGGRR